jgi:hypothetical protein
VNLRFVFEGMEECAFSISFCRHTFLTLYFVAGSEGLDDLIKKEAAAADSWFKGVDCVCIVSIQIWLMVFFSDEPTHSLTTTGLTHAHLVLPTVFVA